MNWYAVVFIAWVGVMGFGSYNSDKNTHEAEMFKLQAEKALKIEQEISKRTICK